MSEEDKLTGHSALIAGACGDIGREVAKLLAAEGCMLHLADTDEVGLGGMADDLYDVHELEVEIYFSDLSDSINCAALAMEADEVSILVNAFGSIPTGDFLSLEADDWQEGFERRVFGAINLSREVLESMQDLQSGIIVNVGGRINDAEELSHQLCIQTANAAIQAFSENLDKQTKREGIRVLTFLPENDMEPQEQATALTRLIFSKLSS